MSPGTPPENVHASLVAVSGHGILIRGPERSGKSALALSLLRAAARQGAAAGLVADDRVELERCGERLVGAAPPAIAGLLEVSGVGILRLPAIESAAVHLVADLEDAPERLPAAATVVLLGLAVRRISLAPRQATFSADVILTLLDPATGLATDDAMHNAPGAPSHPALRRR